MPTHTPSERRKNVNRLGSSFGGLLGNAVTALKGESKRGLKKKGKKQLTRNQRLANI